MPTVCSGVDCYAYDFKVDEWINMNITIMEDNSANFETMSNFRNSAHSAD